MKLKVDGLLMDVWTNESPLSLFLPFSRFVLSLSLSLFRSFPFHSPSPSWTFFSLQIGIGSSFAIRENFYLHIRFPDSNINLENSWSRLPSLQTFLYGWRAGSVQVIGYICHGFQEDVSLFLFLLHLNFRHPDFVLYFLFPGILIVWTQ